ncbi:polysaccharide deacetylase family protein [Candidatus Villigracilis affinis]|uniref:polysaccharide deacetylase family protein n=1 Tax=Candidatus Villigracilis affinis TaxID=3140682 RepID=UPI001D88C698|nr:polysaccharide deacetylase family protein [Anaerolineales bacterium]
MKKKTSLLLLIFLFLTSCTLSAQSGVTVTPSSIPSATYTKTPLPTITATPYLTPTPPAELITSGDWTSPYVALTFDMCQDPLYPAGYDIGVVDVLQRYNVPATFFMGGDWMRTHPDETKALAANLNFEFGNHSWSHADFTTLTQEQIGQEIDMTEDMLFQLTGKHSRLFRLPSGLYNESTLQVVASHGLYTIQWDSVTGDPDPTFDAATILSEVQRTVQNGSIIIMHGNGRGWHTAEALPLVIDYLKDKGYTLVTVSQLIGLEPLPQAE